MVRLLLATTAVAAILSASAVAQDASSSSMAPADTMSSSSSMAPAPADDSVSASSAASSAVMDSSAMSSDMSMASSMESSMMDTPASMSSAPADTTTTTTTTTAVTPRAPVQILSGYTRVDSDQLATKIIGKPVFDSTATDANNLGNINDLVLNQNGEVAAVVLGVGGFLGLGEKQVAVDYSALQWVVAADNTERFVLQTTKDELTSAPDFQTVDDQPGDSSVPVDNTVSSAAQ